MKAFGLKDVIYLVVIVLLVAAVITVSVLYRNLREKKKQEDLSSYYNKKCASFEVQNANLSEGQIVFIGDT